MKLDNSKLWRIAGSVVIVIAAFALMLPGFISYTASLWRIGLLILLTLLVAWIVSFALAKVTVSRRAPK